VRYRYPGESADQDEARLAFKAAQAVRKFIRQRLETKARKRGSRHHPRDE